MEKKMTKKEMFSKVIALVNSVECEEKQEMLDFLNHEVELLNKKASKSGQTKTQKENEVLVEVVFEALATVEKPVTVTEFQNEVVAMSEFSNQKLSALLRKLVESGRVVKTVDKKKSYFSVADVEVEGE